MPCDEAQVRRALRDGTHPDTKPTLQQADEIASLTYDNDANDIMKRMLQRRIDPGAYVTSETENTFLMLRRCIYTASEDFVEYVKQDLAPLISQFYHKGTGNTGDLCGLHEAAKTLLTILQDEASLAGERHLHLASKADKARKHERQDDITQVASPAQSFAKALPMTPPATPGLGRGTSPGKKISQNIARPAPVTPTSPTLTRSYGGLPTPAHSPWDAYSQLESLGPISLASSSAATVQHARVEDRVKTLTSNTPPPITTKQMEEIVDMTFDKSEHDVVWKIIDLRLGALKSQHTYYHLVKTLTLIHHCLFYAADDFVEYCRRRRNIIEDLYSSRGPTSDVRGRAEAILDRLNDEAKLRQERQSRKLMSKRYRANTQLSIPKSSDASIASPPVSPVIPRPTLHDAGVVVKKIGEHAVSYGGYSDVWKGTMTKDHGATLTLVAVKVLRLGASSNADPDRLYKRLEREVRVWQLLHHESIAEFHGIIYQSNRKPAIISPWYDKGSADIYLQQNLGANPMKTLWEVILGIEYLHAKGIVHGDLKGNNVMVDDTGHAKLIDFGLSRLIDSVAGPSGLTTSTVAFSIRWCAPELVKNEDSETTKATDIYSFASTALQLLTGEVPYSTLKERAVLVTVIQGVRPRRLSRGLRYNVRGVENLWSLLESCWAEAELRPSISEVKERMRLLYRP